MGPAIAPHIPATGNRLAPEALHAHRRPRQPGVSAVTPTLEHCQNCSCVREGAADGAAAAGALGAAAADGAAIVEGAAEVEGALKVCGAVRVDGDVTVDGGVRIGGGVRAGGVATGDGASVIDGAARVDSGGFVDGTEVPAGGAVADGIACPFTGPFTGCCICAKALTLHPMLSSRVSLATLMPCATAGRPPKFMAKTAPPLGIRAATARRSDCPALSPHQYSN
jgi:hypothetical protein